MDVEIVLIKAMIFDLGGVYFQDGTTIARENMRKFSEFAKKRLEKSLVSSVMEGIID